MTLSRGLLYKHSAFGQTHPAAFRELTEQQDMGHGSQGEQLRWLPRALPEKGRAALLQAGAAALGGAVHTRPESLRRPASQIQQWALSHLPLTLTINRILIYSCRQPGLLIAHFRVGHGREWLGFSLSNREPR